MAYSNVKFSYTPGFATWAHDTYHESQVVQIGDRLDLCGTVGSGVDGVIPEGRDEQIDNIFRNIDECIRNHMKEADPDLRNGWDRVISVRSYHMNYEETSEEVLEKMTSCIKKYCPNHCPIWMTVGVKALAVKGLHVVVEVSGYAGK